MQIDCGKNKLPVARISSSEYTFPYKLVIVLLIFSSFRPDRLIPGATFLVHFPTAILAILLLLWVKEPEKIFANIQTKLIFLFFILMVIQLPLSRNPSLAFNTVKSFFAFTIVAYLTRIQFVDTLFKLYKYIKLFLTLSIFFAILGIVSKGKVAVPILGDENDFSLFMNVLIPFAFFLGQEENNKTKKIFYFLAMIVFVAGNITTFSRGGFIGLAGLGIFLVFHSKKKAISLVLFSMIALGMLYFAPIGYWTEIRTIREEGTEEGTGRERIEIWKAGWKMFKKHPLIGVGPFHFGLWLPDYYSFRGRDPQRMWGRVAHSLYLTLLPEMGILGTILFLGILWRNYGDHRYIINLERKKDKLLMKHNLNEEETEIAKRAIRKLYFLSLACGGAMAAYLVTGIFISVLWYGYFWKLTAFWVITANVARGIENKVLAVGHFHS